MGVLETGETVVVECNDGISLGSYTLPPQRYATLLATRWADFFMVA
jgi:hypothetical protein